MQPPSRILVTGAATALGGAVAGALSQAGHLTRPTDTVAAPAHDAAGFRRGSLTDPEFVASLLEGLDAVVHLAPLSLVETMPADAPGEVLDAAARGTHVLMKAIVERGIRHVVQGSTLAVMDAYSDDLEVNEQWRPRPAPAAAHLAPYLAELTAREFTRDLHFDHWPEVICLRFDHLDAAAPGERRLALDAAAGAVVQALATLRAGGSRPRGHRWRVLHVAPLTPDARYTSAAARRAIGYGDSGTEAAERGVAR
jgi:nucleoside-diphosphate-sugar epimerase